MTIIVVRDGVMAADSAYWDSGVVLGHYPKIARLPDGTLAGCAGDPTLMPWFLDWLTRGSPAEEPPKFDAAMVGFGALVMAPDGRTATYTDAMRPIRYAVPYEAVGACRVFALGALAAGATAEQAVRLCIEHTDGAAGTVQVERIDTAPQTP